MAEDEVEIVGRIRVQDDGTQVIERFTKAVQGAGEKTGGFHLKLGALGGMTQHLGQIFDYAFGGIFQNLIMGAASKVGEFFSGFVSGGEEAQNIQAQLQAVLKSTGGVAGVTADQVNNLAGSFSKVTTFSDESIVSGENLLLTFTNIGKDIFPQATEAMLNMSQALGQDMKSSAIQLGKALQDPILGVTALRRVGVNFNDEAKKTIENMVKTGDLAGAQAFILRELNTEFGNSAKAAGQTFAGQMKILNNQFDEAQEKVGMALLPLLQQLGSSIIPKILPVVEALADALATFFTVLGKGGDVSQAAFMMRDALDAAFGKGTGDKVWQLVQTIQNFVTNLMTQLAPAFEFVKAHAKEFIAAIGAIVGLSVVIDVVTGLIAVVTALNLPLVLIVGAVALLAAAWAGDWGGIREKTAAVWAWLQPVLALIWKWLATNIPIAIQTVVKWWNTSFMPALQVVIKWVTGTFIPGFQKLVKFFQSDLPTGVSTGSASIINTFLGALQSVADWISSVFTTVFESVRNFFETLLVNAILFFVGIWNSQFFAPIRFATEFIQNVTLPFYRALAEFFIAVFAAAIRVVGEVWTNIVLPALTSVWAFASGVLHPFFVMLGIFFQTAFSAVLTAMSGIWSNVFLPALTSVWMFISGTLYPLLLTFVNWITTAFNTTVQTLSNLWNQTLLPAIRDVWNYISGTMWPKLTEFVNYLRDKFMSALTLIQSFVAGAFKKAWTDIIGVIDDVIDAIKRAATAFNNFHVNKVINPQSPTPLEKGLRGIADALDEVNGAMPPGMAIIGKNPGTTNSRIYNFNWNGSKTTTPPWMNESTITEISRLSANV